ncbi:MAG: family 10 glycosylhydrolase [Candidatus Melainabacteria bacterium]|nr:MAG: family 10 glycosylhydrolase [Candidatus Melainabacteria bacterium]
MDLINSYLPGQRGANQLIVYTPNYQFKTTGTNEFGTEAIVVDGIVTQINGADSYIPPNGFVLSGHGRAKKWINENITVGSYVIIDNEKNILYTFITPDSFIFNAQEKLSETQSIINYYLKNENGYNYTTSRNYMNKAYNNLEKAKKRPDDVQKIANEAMDNASKALENALPYRNNELKGIWIRPTQTNNDEVVKTLDKIKDAGIDNVFWKHTYTAKRFIKSDILQKYGFIPQYEQFSGFDPLKAFINEAHKRNMKIHIWFESFYVGNKNPKSSPCHILRVKPGWANTTKALYTSDEPVYSISEHNGYFLDPAHPDVQVFLVELINEIITKYKPDGINLDYIRYPQSANVNMASYERSNWGYTQYARYEFKKMYNIDPIDIKYKDENWDNWSNYRQNKITEFVGNVSKICKKNNILLTAVIFPDRNKKMAQKMQDWRTWSLKGYVDGFTPLILTCDKVVAQSQIQDIKNKYITRYKKFIQVYLFHLWMEVVMICCV